MIGIQNITIQSCWNITSSHAGLMSLCWLQMKPKLITTSVMIKESMLRWMIWYRDPQSRFG